MGISARVIADSIMNDVRLTTMEVCYPRIILAEMNTHRVFSRNTASSRAIPVKDFIARVQDDPFVPEIFYGNKPGMQGAEPIEGQDEARRHWLRALDCAVDQTRALAKLNIHKQHLNRLLEPFSYVTSVISSTEWDNFFDQRISPLAQPEIMKTAVAMGYALEGNKPEHTTVHIPYVTKEEQDEYNDPDLAIVDLLHQVSAARCARVSYLPRNGTVPSMEADLKLFNKLASAQPPHWSPMEHTAVYGNFTIDYLPSNFTKWVQYRRIMGG